MILSKAGIDKLETNDDMSKLVDWSAQIKLAESEAKKFVNMLHNRAEPTGFTTLVIRGCQEIVQLCRMCIVNW